MRYILRFLLYTNISVTDVQKSALKVNIPARFQNIFAFLEKLKILFDFFVFQ